MNKRKLIKICTVITSVITVLSLGFRHLFPPYILSKLNIESFGLRNNSSIGIIGSADGPTVVCYGNQFNALNTIIMINTIITIVFGLFSIVGITYLIFSNKVIK